MENSDSDKRFRRILEGFRNTDDLHASFKEFFIDRIIKVIESKYPSIELNDTVAEHIVLYAENTISFTESVMDKDRSFPAYRKREEVERMKSVIEKLPALNEEEVFVNHILSETKKCMVKFFPEIYELSGDGFRLLDVNARFFNHGFFTNIESIEV